MRNSGPGSWLGHCRQGSCSFGGVIVLVLLAGATPGFSHELNQMHYFVTSRTLEISPVEIRVRHDSTLLPGVEEKAMADLDEDGDSTVSQRELATFYTHAARHLAEEFLVELEGGDPVLTLQDSFRVKEDGSGFVSELLSRDLELDPQTTTTLRMLDPAFERQAAVRSAPTRLPVYTRGGMVIAPQDGQMTENSFVLPAYHTIIRLTPAAAASSTGGK